jgi:hypothetical protein
MSVVCLQVQQFDLQFGGTHHGHAPCDAGRPERVLSGAMGTVEGDAVVLACGVACSPAPLVELLVQDEKPITRT